MDKGFAEWHLQKEKMHQNMVRVLFHEREIWFASLGANIGFEQDGSGKRFLRPVIVLKKFNHGVLWCLPLTKTLKDGDFYCPLVLREVNNTVLLSQMRLIDAKRLLYKISNVNKVDFEKIKEKLRRLLV